TLGRRDARRRHEGIQRAFLVLERRTAPHVATAPGRTFCAARFRHTALRCDHRRSGRLHAALVGRRVDVALGDRRRHAGLFLPGQSTMRTRFLTSAIVAFGLAIMWVTPATAHHSFAAEFDGSKPITLTGTVTQIDWANPHVWFYITVKDEE